MSRPEDSVVLLAHPNDVVKPHARLPQPLLAGVCYDLVYCAHAWKRMLD
jgi:hypothetical protein